MPTRMTVPNRIKNLETTRRITGFALMVIGLVAFGPPSTAAAHVPSQFVGRWELSLDDTLPHVKTDKGRREFENLRERFSTLELVVEESGSVVLYHVSPTFAVLVDKTSVRAADRVAGKLMLASQAELQIEGQDRLFLIGPTGNRSVFRRLTVERAVEGPFSRVTLRRLLQLPSDAEFSAALNAIDWKSIGTETQTQFSTDLAKAEEELHQTALDRERIAAAGGIDNPEPYRRALTRKLRLKSIIEKVNAAGR